MKRRETKYARQGGRKVHVSAEGFPYVGRCGEHLHGDEYLARLVPEAERCRKPKCRDAWPAMLRSVS